MHDELCAYLSKNITVEPKALTYGDGPNGSNALRAIMAPFLTKHLKPVKPVKPEHIMVTAGVSAAIEHVSWALADPGDGVLLGRPYYRAFLPDIELRTGAKVVSVSFGKTDPCGIECVGKYEEAILQAKEEGIKIRALMLCHPHNPLGRCYSRPTMIALMKLCQKYGVHFVSDEIYALSIFENTIDTGVELVEFESALAIASDDVIDPARVHVLWGMSKDFGANGIRVGAIVSQDNPEFLAACRTCGIYSSPSSLAENATMRILADSEFVEKYVKENQRRLSDAYSHVVRKLKEYRIEHAPGVTAAMFVWVNLGKAYFERHPEALFEGGDITPVLFEKLMDKRIFIVGGDVAGAEEPGWFRIVFTQPMELVDEGLKRMVEAIS